MRKRLLRVLSGPALVAISGALGVAACEDDIETDGPEDTCAYVPLGERHACRCALFEFVDDGVACDESLKPSSEQCTGVTCDCDGEVQVVYACIQGTCLAAMNCSAWCAGDNNDRVTCLVAS